MSFIIADRSEKFDAILKKMQSGITTTNYTVYENTPGRFRKFTRRDSFIYTGRIIGIEEGDKSIQVQYESGLVITHPFDRTDWDSAEEYVPPHRR